MMFFSFNVDHSPMATPSENNPDLEKEKTIKAKYNSSFSVVRLLDFENIYSSTWHLNEFP